MLTTKLGSIDLSMVDIFHRMLLTNNGTLTKLLEATFLEKITIKKVEEKTVINKEIEDLLNLEEHEELTERVVLLQGQEKTNYTYAKSYLVFDRLGEEIKAEMINTKTTVGNLWVKYKSELYKEFVDYRVEKAGEIAEYFGIDEESNVYSRSFIVYSDGKAIIMITEKFPVEHLRRLYIEQIKKEDFSLSPQKVDDENIPMDDRELVS